MTNVDVAPASRTRIKICGLTREQDVDAAVAAGVDAIGFVRYPKSARVVSIARAVELATGSAQTECLVWITNLEADEPDPVEASA